MFPDLSVAVHVTVVVPIGNVEPEGGAHITGTEPSTRSLEVGFVYFTTAPVFSFAWTVISVVVPVIFGGVVSTMVIVCVAVVLFP